MCAVFLVVLYSAKWQFGEVRASDRERNFESVGRQTIAGAEAASAAKSPVAGEKHIGVPPNGGPTEGGRLVRGRITEFCVIYVIIF